MKTIFSSRAETTYKPTLQIDKKAFPFWLNSRGYDYNSEDDDDGYDYGEYWLKDVIFTSAEFAIPLNLHLILIF